MHILLLPDQTGWAMDSIATSLQIFLPDIAIAKKKLHRRITRKSASKYDIVNVMYPPYVWDFDPSSSVFVAGVHSFCELGIFGPNDTLDADTMNMLRPFKRLQAPCKSMYNLLMKHGLPARYAPSGFDPNLFFPKKRVASQKLRFGFAGNPDKHGAVKGFHDIIVPAFAEVKDVELVVALGGDDQIDHEKMVDFYNSIDMLICMSSSETGPLPVLEAMACGTPVLSTAVGLVPEVVSNMIDGVTINRDRTLLTSWLRHLADNREIVDILASNCLKSVQKWSWPMVAHYWRTFFEDALEE